MATKKRSTFGGGALLGVPTPLPDDDEPTQGTANAPAANPEPAPEPPNAVEEPSPAPAPLRAVQAAPAPSEQTSEPATGREKPPSTLRLNDVAGKALWDAFLEAKRADPFLSYRQFASHVVLNGLSKAKR